MDDGIGGTLVYESRPLSEALGVDSMGLQQNSEIRSSASPDRGLTMSVQQLGIPVRTVS